MDLAKMKLPKLRTCCFCIPLRGGLLTWGYVNLIFHLVVFGWSLVIAFASLVLAGMAQEFPPIEVVVLLPVVVICIITQSLLVVVAGHTDNIRMLKGLFIAGTILWIFEVLYCPCLSSRMIISDVRNQFDILELFVFFVVIVILEPFLQTYVLLLIRSMVLKLEEKYPKHESVEYTNINKNETEIHSPNYLRNV